MEYQVHWDAIRHYHLAGWSMDGCLCMKRYTNHVGAMTSKDLSNSKMGEIRKEKWLSQKHQRQEIWSSPYFQSGCFVSMCYWNTNALICVLFWNLVCLAFLTERLGQEIITTNTAAVHTWHNYINIHEQKHKWSQIQVNAKSKAVMRAVVWPHISRNRIQAEIDLS